MTRFKGRVSFIEIERDFPHHVDMQVPEGGLGNKLNAMYDWHQTHGVEAMRGRGWRDENGREHIRWCFADPAVALEFADQFGGVMQLPPSIL